MNRYVVRFYPSDPDNSQYHEGTTSAVDADNIYRAQEFAQKIYGDEPGEVQVTFFRELTRNDG